jgi:pteridine reductase
LKRETPANFGSTIMPEHSASNRTDLAGQVALITGAAQRIGAALARMLHGAGCDLILHYRNSADAAEALATELSRARPGSADTLRADLCDPHAPTAMIDEVEHRRGRLDILVNNASSFYPTPLGTAGEAEWDDLMGSNLKGPFFLAKAAVPLLRQHGGCIVNLVDIHAERPLKGHAIYCMAKAGNAMMVKSLARELGPDIRVNGIAPGAILWPDQGLDAAAKTTILERTALARPGSPEDIGRTLLFLVRDAPYITGQIIAVDGGRTLQQ